MNLLRALRLDQQQQHRVICFVGSGGKTTALFQLARQLIDLKRNTAKYRSVIITATSHLGVWQIPLADHHIQITDGNEKQIPQDGIVLITGEIHDNRYQPITENTLKWLRAY